MNYESELLDTKTKVMYNIAPNDKCVQTDFCEKKNYTIAQFEAYQVRRKKSRLNIKICLKEFSNSAHLTQNIESVHSKKSVKKKHPCKLCNKQFSRSDTLTKHIRTEHTGVMYPGSKNITNKISANQKQEKIKVSFLPPYKTTYCCDKSALSSHCRQIIQKTTYLSFKMTTLIRSVNLIQTTKKLLTNLPKNISHQQIVKKATLM